MTRRKKLYVTFLDGGFSTLLPAKKGQKGEPFQKAYDKLLKRIRVEIDILQDRLWELETMTEEDFEEGL